MLQKKQLTTVLTKLFSPYICIQISIGRKKCNIICEGKRISHTHCELEFNDEQWFVKDLKVKNGNIQNF